MRTPSKSENALAFTCLAAALLFAPALCSAQETPQQPAGSTIPAEMATPANTGDVATATTSNPSSLDTGGGSVQPPVVIHMTTPKYSEEARVKRFSGKVLVSLIVDTNGMPTKVHVLRRVGMGLDDEAVDAVKQYRFKPATRNGRPVAVYVNVEVNFQIVSRR